MKVSDLQHSTLLANHNQKVSTEKRDEKLWKASKDMESVFLSYMIKAMEKTIPDGALTGSKNSLSKMMFSSVMSKEMTNSGGIGLSKHIYDLMKDNNSDALQQFKSEDHSDFLYNLKFPEVTDE